MKSIYKSTKTYGHEVGLSCCFRQWRAKSHCRLLHGYALSVKFVFFSEYVDETNWCMDFGALKPVKQWLENMFDHKLVVVDDDPFLSKFQELDSMRMVDLVVVKNVGCEAFAELIYDFTNNWLAREGHRPRVNLASVEVREHGANSAIYQRVPEPE